MIQSINKLTLIIFLAVMMLSCDDIEKILCRDFTSKENELLKYFNEKYKNKYTFYTGPCDVKEMSIYCLSDKYNNVEIVNILNILDSCDAIDSCDTDVRWTDILIYKEGSNDPELYLKTVNEGYVRNKDH